MLSSPLPDSEIGRSAVAHRPVADRGIGQAPPRGGISQRHEGLAVGVALGREHGEPLDRRATKRDGGGRIQRDVPQLGDEPVEGDLVPRTTRDREGLTAAQRRSDIVDETTRPVTARVLLVDRRDVQLAPGARAGHVEQPPLLLEQIGGPRTGADAGRR